jgi:hypothetical protein
MKMEISTSQLIILILVLILLYCLSNDTITNQIFGHKHPETFINLDKEPQSDALFDYLLTDGKLFYLYNSRDLIVKDENPLLFETLDEAEAYRQKTATPKLDVIDLVVRKTEDDPQENYERECAKKISPFNFRANTCMAYAKDGEALNKITDSIDNMSIDDHDLESCQIQKVLEDNPELKPNKNNENEIQFMSQFF